MKRTGPVGIVTLVCITCGRGHTYDEAMPESIKCETCNGTVFRQFATPTENDEASVAQAEEQARSTSLGDPSPSGSREDARDMDGR